jgi:hypothetical protein
MTLNLIRRLVKGTPLTAAEHDGNLDKLENGIEARPTTSEQGTAIAAAVAAHVAAADPHPGYLTPAEGNAAYVGRDDARLTDAREWTAATIEQAEAEAGTATTRRAFTAQRVRQAIAAWWTSVSTAAGRAMAEALDAAAQRTLLGLGTGDSPSFTGLAITGLAPVVIPHIHGSIAGDFYVHVRNTSGGPLAAGTAVYVVGSVGDTDRITVAACDPTDPAKMPAIGILQTTLAQNGDGDAVVLGELRPFNTGGYQIRDRLYVGAGGALVATPPASGLVQAVGSVARVNAETGTILVGVGAAMARVGFTGAYADLSGLPPLGTAAAQSVGTNAGNVVQLDNAAKLPAVDGSQLTNLPTGGAGTDLSYTASTRVLASSTGADATLPLATTSDAGLLSSADKTKLDGIEAGAQVNVGTDLSYTASSRLLTSSTGADVTLPEATTTLAGLQSAADKTKLDGIAAGAEVNINADWNATTGDAAILNKPTLGTAAAQSVGTNAGNVVQLDNAAKLPAVDGSQLTNLPAPAGTDLTYDAPTREVRSSTGTDATLPLVSTTTAGLQPATGFGTITYAATVNLDLAALDGQVNTITATGPLELTTSNLANGRSTGLRLIPGASSRTLIFPVDWVFVSAKPASIPANKVARLSIECHGTTNAAVVAAIAIQP